MKKCLPLFLFVDACGWEIIRNDPFVKDVAPHRRPLRSVFGYSSACIPSILAGSWPSAHRNWCYFVYDPKNSPFCRLTALRWIPRFITSRRRVRNIFTKAVKRLLGFKGYFDLYNVPFKNIALFDFTEKKNPLQPGGMNRGPNIFDFLEERGIAYHVSEPARGEKGNLDALVADLEAERPDFAFLYWPELDGLLHRVGNTSPEIPKKLRDYETRIARLMAVAREHYEEVRLYVFSDHGMANCDKHLDLRARIDALGLAFGRDYAVVYDSTMARFWFFNDRARQAVIAALATVPEGRVLSDGELERLGTLFPDRYFGELIFLLEEGALIVPSDMGERPIRAMHGYHPEAPHSYAALMTNQADVPAGIVAIPDMYKLMIRDARHAHEANHVASGVGVPATAPAPRETTGVAVA